MIVLFGGKPAFGTRGAANKRSGSSVLRGGLRLCVLAVQLIAHLQTPRTVLKSFWLEIILCGVHSQERPQKIADCNNRAAPLPQSGSIMITGPNGRNAPLR
jgi:hypothetical protein